MDHEFEIDIIYNTTVASTTVACCDDALSYRDDPSP